MRIHKHTVQAKCKAGGRPTYTNHRAVNSWGGRVGMGRIDDIEHTSGTCNGSHDNIISSRLTRSLRQTGQGCVVLQFILPMFCNPITILYDIQNIASWIYSSMKFVQMMDNSTSPLGLPSSCFQDEYIASPVNLLPVWTWIRHKLSQSACCIQILRHQQCT